MLPNMGTMQYPVGGADNHAGPLAGGQMAPPQNPPFPQSNIQMPPPGGGALTGQPQAARNLESQLDAAAATNNGTGLMNTGGAPPQMSIPLNHSAMAPGGAGDGAGSFPQTSPVEAQGSAPPNGQATSDVHSANQTPGQLDQQQLQQQQQQQQQEQAKSPGWFSRTFGRGQQKQADSPTQHQQRQQQQQQMQQQLQSDDGSIPPMAPAAMPQEQKKSMFSFFGGGKKSPTDPTLQPPQQSAPPGGTVPQAMGGSLPSGDAAAAEVIPEKKSMFSFFGMGKKKPQDPPSPQQQQQLQQQQVQQLQQQQQLSTEPQYYQQGQAIQATSSAQAPLAEPAPSAQPPAVQQQQYSPPPVQQQPLAPPADALLLRAPGEPPMSAEELQQLEQPKHVRHGDDTPIGSGRPAALTSGGAHDDMGDELSDTERA